MMFLQSCFQCASPSHQIPPYLPFITSRNLLFGLLLFLFPGNSISITLLPTYFWSLLMTCLYHLSLPLIFISTRSTLTVTLMYSFLILSFLVTPIANLCDFHLFHLFLCDRHRFKSIHHCWSHH